MEAPKQDVVNDFQEHVDLIREEIGKVIVGQKDIVEKVLIAIFCRGHALMMGVPGLAKTLLVNTMSQVMGLSFSRVQFTPDLLPADIVGTDVLQEDPESGRAELEFMPGPIFANLLLADEINRTPPKTQAALLEGMQERRVTAGGHTLELPTPFFVLATQNPIEQEGTYNLPEAQLDRFFFMLHVEYPNWEEELEVMERYTTRYEPHLEEVVSGEDILRYQNLVEQVLVRPEIFEYALRIVRATRVSEEYADDYCREYVSWGAGPRASLYIILGAKCHALFQGRSYVNTEDIRQVAVPVLNHRIVLNYTAVSENIHSTDVVHHVLRTVESPVQTA